MEPITHNFSRRLTATLAACAMAASFALPRLAHAAELDVAPPTLPDERGPGQVSEPAPETGSPTSAPVMVEGAAPPAAPPPPRVDEQLSLTGRALWEGLEGREVSLVLADESELRGTVVTQNDRFLAFARTSDGTVVAVPKTEIRGVRLVARSTVPEGGARPGHRPLDDGRRAYGAGVALLGLGVPVSVSGTVMLGICPGCLYIHLPLLLPGLGMIIGGSLALRGAKQKQDAFRRAWGIPHARLRMTPTLSASRRGGEVGFVLRF